LLPESDITRNRNWYVPTESLSAIVFKTTSVASAMGKQAEAKVDDSLFRCTAWAAKRDIFKLLLGSEAFKRDVWAAIMSRRKGMLAGTNHNLRLASPPSTPIPFHSYQSAEEPAHNPVCDAEVPFLHMCVPTSGSGLISV